MQASERVTSQQEIEERVQKGARFIPVFEECTLDPAMRPVEIFSDLLKGQAQPGGEAFFLQRSRAEGESHAPHESLLAFDPFEKIRVRHADPFTILSEKLKEYQAIGYEGLPFFQGGALGYFAYDAIRFLEPSLTALPGNLRSLGAESLGYDAEFMLFRKLVIFSHDRRKIAYLSGLFPGKEPVAEGWARARAEIQGLKKAVSDAHASHAVHDGAASATPAATEIAMEAMEPMLGKERFMRGVKKLKENIRNGDIFQAVLSEKLTVPFDGDPLVLFRELTRLSPAPYRFYFKTGESVFLGASPEMLLKVRGRELETHPIAGTRPRGANEAEEHKLEGQLMRSEKERAEHLMLVDLARNDIGRVSEPGTVRVNAYMQIKKFSGVMHLVSKVTGRLLQSSSSIEALAACFPAGTLSGAPKIRAMQLLSELEPHPRGFYGGAVVAASFTGDLDSCISIRSIQIEDGQAIVQAGAGIVADSQPLKEYEEVSHKCRISRTALAEALS